jgi:hypothetical protein
MVPYRRPSDTYPLVVSIGKLDVGTRPNYWNAHAAE